MISRLELLAISTYQIVTHPVYRVLEKAHIDLFKCKYSPSCSAYAQQAIAKYGARKGTVLALKRIFRCNPHSRGGEDPLI